MGGVLTAPLPKSFIGQCSKMFRLGTLERPATGKMVQYGTSTHSQFMVSAALLNALERSLLRLFTGISLLAMTPPQVLWLQRMQECDVRQYRFGAEG